IGPCVGVQGSTGCGLELFGECGGVGDDFDVVGAVHAEPDRHAAGADFMRVNRAAAHEDDRDNEKPETATLMTHDSRSMAGACGSGFECQRCPVALPVRLS